MIVIFKLVFLLVFVDHLVNGDGVVSLDFSWKENENGAKYENVCPNNKTKCTERQTCCVTKHNSYHCCKYPNAVCCPDKFHCCPEGSKCDVRRHRCSRSDNKMKKLLVPLNSPQLESDTLFFGKPKVSQESMCPNNKTKCKDTKTCCITLHGNYYCCPHKNAVCCSDKYQCCPEKTTCDIKNKKCVSQSVMFDSHEEERDVIKPTDLKTIALSLFELISNGVDVTKKCPNTNYSCKGEKTCCAMLNGKFGCCELGKAVCCPDMKTCCPHSTVCDVANGKCVTNLRDLTEI